LSLDKKWDTLSLEHRDLGIVLKEIRPAIEQNDSFELYSQLSVRMENNRWKIKAENPKSAVWEWIAEKDSIKILGPEKKNFLLGLAPASESRIPARTEDQDNGILYTSLGPVSARNIRQLFDRPTDTLIRFPPDSLLSRSNEDNRFMSVRIPLSGNSRLSLIRNYYTDSLGLKYYKPKRENFSAAPVAWSSWYCYYMGTTEDDMVRETDALAEHLKPFGLEYIQLDACYTRGPEANYLEWNRGAFPRGGKWLFEYIKNKGLKPALWVNVYGSNYVRPETADKYPENFYLRNKKDELSSACCTADDTVVRLDYTNPAVIEQHLKPMFRTLVHDWGLKYIKDAGWGTWMDYYEKNREKAFDSTRDSRDVYLEVQKALRETLGPDVYVGGCAMHEVGLGFGIFDGSRTGGDDKAVWYPEKKGGMSMQTYFHSLFGANFLNNITWHCDPDAAMVRNPLTLEEGRTIVTAIALTGQLYMASDFMAKLPLRKMELYKKTIPATPVVPIDLYPFRVESNKRNGVVWCCPRLKEFPRAVDLKVNGAAGIYDVAALFNWSDEEAVGTLSLIEDLGLEGNKKYLVFDFWNQNLTGITEEILSAGLPPHGTRVFVIKPILDHPQVIATSRHITGTVSLKTAHWDDARSVLHGTSKIVPGEHYSIFIHVPDGSEAVRITADIEPLFSRMDKGILEVKFDGKSETSNGVFDWDIQFKSEIKNGLS
jgi:hypothetical protein